MNIHEKALRVLARDTRQQSVELPDGEVHIWRILAHTFLSQVKYLSEVLAHEEKERASRFYFEKDRLTFMIIRGLLRVIIGQYIKAEPAEIQFDYNAFGKPFLRWQEGASAFHFNVSHSHGVALVAITRRKRIGIDLEKIRPILDADVIVDRFFTPQEAANLKSVPFAEQGKAFFTWWTCKEAFVKAIGEGLAYPLDQFDIVDVIQDSMRVMGTISQGAQRWSLLKFSPYPNYVGALVIEEGLQGLQCWYIDEKMKMASYAIDLM